MKPRHCGILLALGTLCQAWQANFSDATQCGDVTVNWSGTTAEKLAPPFVVRMAAFGLAPVTINVPTSAWSDSTRTGSYSFSMPWPTGTKFVTSMDDGFGSGTGGVTGIQTVRSSSNSSCVTAAVTQPEHVFDLYGTYVQCSVLSMNWSEPATSKTLITGLVPNGVAFQLDPPTTNSKSTTWNLNIPAGTAFVLMYVAPSGPGLTSPLLVSRGDGASDACLSSGAFPSATASQVGVAEVTSTATLPPGSSASASSSATPSSSEATGSGAKLGPILGATLGTVAFLVALGLIICLCMRRRRYKRVRAQSPALAKEMNLQSDNSPLDYSRAHSAFYHSSLPEGAVVLPFVLPTTSSTQETQSSSVRKEPFRQHTRAVATRQSRDTFESADSSHNTPGGSSSRPRRGTADSTEDDEPVFIRHEDGGSMPMQRVREVIELPPGYDQLSRPPPLPQPQQSDSQGHSQSPRKRGLSR